MRSVLNFTLTPQYRVALMARSLGSNILARSTTSSPGVITNRRSFWITPIDSVFHVILRLIGCPHLRSMSWQLRSQLQLRFGRREMSCF